MRASRRVPARDRSRGVATIELALSMTFLIPLLFAVADFGYYFFIGQAAEDAARVGVRAAVRQSAGGNCAATQAAVKATGEAYAPGGTSGRACIVAGGGSAACLLNEPPFRLGQATGGATITLTCAGAPVNPTWSIAVQVDFRPAVGFFRAWMPAGTAGMVRYTARLTSN